MVVALARNGVETRAVTPEREMELFFPHLTVAQGLTAERAVQVLGAARAHHEPQSFQAERLVLGRSWDELSWESAWLALQ